MAPVGIEVNATQGEVYMGEYRGEDSATSVAGKKATVPPDLEPRFAFREQSPTRMWVRTMDVEEGILVEASLELAGGKVGGEDLAEGQVRKIGETTFTGLPKVS